MTKDKRAAKPSVYFKEEIMETPILGHISLYYMMAYFFIYAFLGWITEVIFATLKTGKFVNRGFLNGPLCPIYGAGMAICVLLLNGFAEKWWLLFLVGGALATFLELITGFVLDKLFKTKWWDYSKEPFNVKGYVCLRFAIIWGLAVLLVFKTLVPLTDKLISLVPFKWWGAGILAVLWVIFLADFITVLKQLKGLKADLKETSRIAELIHRDSNFIGKRVSDATLAVSQSLKKVTVRLEKSRLIKAFPRLKKSNQDLNSECEKAELEIDKSNDEKE